MEWVLLREAESQKEVIFMVNILEMAQERRSESPMRGHCSQRPVQSAWPSWRWWLRQSLCRDTPAHALYVASTVQGGLMLIQVTACGRLT